MNDECPDPDTLLARVERKEQQRKRGRLKIFFGAGVGKTYTMLLAAQSIRLKGIDVVIGLVETHERQETIAVLQGLDVLPPKLVQYRGTVQREFDLDKENYSGKKKIVP